MSVADHLVETARSIESILEDINVQLLIKESTAASTLSEVDEKIAAIDLGIHPRGEYPIYSNGDYNILNYASVHVEVPTGTIRNSGDVTVSGPTVHVTEGLYQTDVDKSVTTTTVATPSVTINTSTGLVTATSSQSEGYVYASTTSDTLAIVPIGPEIYRPGRSSIIIGRDKYLTGDLTIEGSDNLLPQNIRRDVTIFGVTGNYDAPVGGNALPEDILPGKSAYVNGILVNGDMPTKGSEAYTPSRAGFTIPAGVYLTGDQDIRGDDNLVPENIVDGITIFGVRGNGGGGGGTVPREYVVSPSTELTPGTMASISADIIDVPSINPFGPGVDPDTQEIAGVYLSAIVPDLSSINENTVLAIFVPPDLGTSGFRQNVYTPIERHDSNTGVFIFGDNHNGSFYMQFRLDSFQHFANRPEFALSTSGVTYEVSVIYYEIE